VSRNVIEIIKFLNKTPFSWDRICVPSQTKNEVKTRLVLSTSWSNFYLLWSTVSVVGIASNIRTRRSGALSPAETRKLSFRWKVMSSNEHTPPLKKDTGSKRTAAWIRSLTTIYSSGLEWVELYLCPLIRLQGQVLVHYLLLLTLTLSWRIKDTCYFISLLMCSTCFGH